MITKNQSCIHYKLGFFINLKFIRSKLKRGDANKIAKTVNNNKPNMLQENPKDKTKFT